MMKMKMDSLRLTNPGLSMEEHRRFFRPVFILLLVHVFNVRVGSTLTGVGDSPRMGDPGWGNKTVYEVNTTADGKAPLLLFEKHPPSFSLHDAGDEAQFECVERNYDEVGIYLTASWSAPPGINIIPTNNSLSNSTSRHELENVYNYIANNNSLVFERLEKVHAGRYLCVLYDMNGEKMAETGLRIHVVDISKIDYTKKVLYGLVGAVGMTVVILLIYFYINVQEKRKEDTNYKLDEKGETALPIL